MRHLEKGAHSKPQAVLESLAPFANTYRVLNGVLAVWPEHAPYCRARFGDDTPAFRARMEEVAGLILRIAGGDLAKYCLDYRWTSEEFLKEEVYFRRHGRYRRSTFAEAYRDVYANNDYMPRYMRGVLISQLLWSPHAKAIDCFRTHFLPQLPANSSYLEIGPGHGLYLYFACNCQNLSVLEAWDVSASSIAETQLALTTLGASRTVTIVEQDVLNASVRYGGFDGVAISEVLEHLERPDVALRELGLALKPGGEIFINAPLNSPAPDHIYLWRSPEEFCQFVTAQGLAVESCNLFPVTGAALDYALRQQLMISCVVIATRPPP